MIDALCGFLRGNVYCKGKEKDVIHVEEGPIIHKIRTQRRHSIDEAELTWHHTRNWFPGKTVLEIGDPSRNVIEMIFKATTDTTRCSINIKQVIKLNNSRETLENFEKFREDVKNRDECYNKHPRNNVDGNEHLMFYGTKLTCCKQFATSKLCRDSNCNICSLLKSGFKNTAKKKPGIWLTTNCQDLINANSDANLNVEMVNGKMAIMVCRVIIGRLLDMIDSSYEGDYDSIEGEKPNELFVKNPDAVLPCFVIILNCRYI
uniref:uncharacterized protein LOC122599315 n=1 Tax=Erigeron canadensis TaxID=72917 RepID=UPI001CB9410C|nr:uncharacterized protein LOC122599315 [Erigeron canadensis]